MEKERELDRESDRKVLCFLLFQHTTQSFQFQWSIIFSVLRDRKQIHLRKQIGPPALQKWDELIFAIFTFATTDIHDEIDNRSVYYHRPPTSVPLTLDTGPWLSAPLYEPLHAKLHSLTPACPCLLCFPVVVQAGAWPL